MQKQLRRQNEEFEREGEFRQAPPQLGKLVTFFFYNWLNQASKLFVE